MVLVDILDTLDTHQQAVIVVIVPHLDLVDTLQIQDSQATLEDRKSVV